MRHFLFSLLAFCAGSALAAPTLGQRDVTVTVTHSVTQTVTQTYCPPAPPPTQAPINPIGKVLDLGGGQTVTITQPTQTVTKTVGAGPTQTAYVFNAYQFVEQNQNTQGQPLDGYGER